MSSELLKIQNCQIDMALEVKRICRKYNLKYFLTYGSMLGAVRHHGFIPWDDDLDIGMPREDYEKFVNLCSSELDEDYQLITWENDKDYANIYAKMMIRGSKYEEHEMRYADATKGIFIDVFPYDHYPRGNTSVLRKKIKILRFMIYSKCKYAFDNYSIFYKAMSRVLRIILIPVTKKYLCNILGNVEKKYNSIDCEKIINYNAGSRGKDWIYSEDIDELIEVDFEGYRFNIIKNYDEFLSHYYGDYMTPPPLDKRENRHGIMKIDYGTYKIKNPIMRPHYGE